ncbi:UDP-N-acetylmuramoyl-tripeptide--D-alanyl-D-alanine ligase [Robertmurraya siralis]|uniref:UDP-N-acetylmuramoyl-tripeptide--D-alanyl-D-alanine ligase n=1 Tax=Robertmurraya siralis TaxID=77777 RepID=A0A920BVL5_9BACI|nr:UDP-N-acetylmuramoyl-tripeptide--D-alanyl-D-alanine ligase [Robertmurraya siralis]PAE19834.1 UDP-N-acetylmuramoyl-tripeptide--D-alanyl-D-alanine ligase [Bacillus sp. 7504-2]GIN63502.1 UDP-N-acetylmuramoyl-tripeptide--D-alanyl-D-alanine ligase [Robertmurraya siralis]
MIKKTMKQLAKMIQVDHDLEQFANIEISGVTIDSRKIEKGNLFVPFKGEQVDGHLYVEEALEKGAAAALWQKDVPNPPVHLPVIVVENTLEALQELARQYRSELDVKVVGITGSNGKTTTKDITASLLGLQYKVQKTEGNFNNHIGLPLTILGLEEDTEIAVLEMGMSSVGEIEFLTKLARPSAVIITNIGEAHLQDLGSRERIADAKLEIVKGLMENGLIVYHGDEPLLFERLKNFDGDAKQSTFGRFDYNTLYPLDIRQTDTGSHFKVNSLPYEFELPVLGTHNILNALAAMLVAHYFGIPYEKMNDAFSTLKVTNMRMELVEGGCGEKIINDAYNASPTSMKAAIELVTSLSGYEQKILVLGDMLELGPEETSFHYSVGQEIDSSHIDYLFTYGKLGEYIAKGAREHFPANRVRSFLDKELLLQELKKVINAQTLILVKGSRGMKLEEIVQKLQKQ